MNQNRVQKSVSKVENVDEFWDFDYETAFETVLGWLITSFSGVS